MADDPLTAALAPIRDREQAATRGPWEIETESCDCGDGYVCPHGTYPYAIITSRSHTERKTGEAPRPYDFRHSEICELSPEDVEFIAQAREDVPRLLRAVELLIGFHASYMMPAERDKLVAVLTGKENDGG